jgi:MYXO-CTERM domain-containing protein
VANEQGHYSAAMTYVRQKCQADFGFNPFIIVNEDALKNDTTLAAVVDGAHSWNSNGSWSLSTLNNVKVGVAEAGLRAPGAPDSQDPNHGTLFQNNLTKTVGAGAVLTLIEGFTDWEETATLFRVRDLDPSGNAVDYSSTLYDYPNQRLDIIRQHSQSPFPASLLFEAEGADYYGGAAGGNGKTNFYRNGNIAIEATTDTGGGFDVGWMQAGEWLEWEQVPLNSTPHFLARIATSSAGSTAHLVIDGVSKASQTLPNTGGFQNWITFDLGAYGAYTNSYHTVRMVFDNGGVNFNWWQLGAGTTGGSTGTGGATGAAGSPGAGGVTSTAGSTGVGGTGGRSGAAGGAGLEGSMGQGGSVGTAGTVGQGGDNAAAGSHNEGGSSGGNDNGTAPGSPASTSGCSCRVGKSASGSPWLLLGSIALAIAAMRRIAQATASRRERTANSRVAHFDL